MLLSSGNWQLYPQERSEACCWPSYSTHTSTPQDARWVLVIKIHVAEVHGYCKRVRPCLEEQRGKYDKKSHPSKILYTGGKGL